MAKEAGIDLMQLPYTDVRPQRTEWLAKQPKHPAMVRRVQHAHACAASTAGAGPHEAGVRRTRTRSAPPGG